MKKTIVYLVLFVLLCAGSSYGVDYTVHKKINKQSPYYLSFASIGAFSLESEVDCWATINQELTTQELSNRLEELTSYVGAPFNEKEVISSNNQSGVIVAYEYHLPHRTYRFQAESDQEQKKSYLFINIWSFSESLDDLTAIEDELKRSGYKWKYYYLYQGKLDHYLSQDSQAQVINVMMENLGAQKGEVYEGNNLTSVTGYSPLLDNYVKVQNEKYNIQLAITSDMQRNETAIYIGQPLILGGY